jgi:KUP system potassium uptake protein
VSQHPVGKPTGKYLFVLSLGALGIVFGDIGTSPLYAIKETFHGPHAIPTTPANILGILSLIFWALIIVISIKYLVFVMRADNRGEGGILALMSLIAPRAEGWKKRRFLIFVMALFGASLLYGDGISTPAITVLSAVEGLQVATPLFKPYVVPLALVILVGLFMMQRRGTAGIGAIFGPVMVVWFSVLAALGVYRISQWPDVLFAANPKYAFYFFQHNGWIGFFALGTVFLVVTGGEALYADMGHFGVRPIRSAWFTVVLPALLLNYFGQGALLLHHPEAAENPFFRMVPSFALYPIVALATVAASVASQAVISGAFSLTRQAVQLGYMPRLEIEHTSESQIGQIYIPSINWLLMFACIGLVLGFKTSSNLAAAYGVAVTTDMVFTSILFAVFARRHWRWSLPLVILLATCFLIVDVSFWTANIIKVPQGGWFPLVIALCMYTLMTTWRKGRQILDDRLKKDALPVDLFVKSISARPPVRVPGTAVFMFRNPEGTPTALLHNLKHNKVLHDRVILMTIITEEVSTVQTEERYTIEELGAGIYRMILHYGFVEDPDIPAVLEQITEPFKLEASDTTYFLGRETLIPTKHPGMAIWREKLFASMTNNARGAASFFRLPPNRVVELGAQIEL